MSLPWYLLMPFTAAFAFALANVLQKRAFQEGADVVVALAVNQVVLGLVFLPLLVITTRPVSWGLWWQPGLTALAFFTGSLSGLAAVRLGDVSLVTPLLGTKVILVALLSLVWNPRGLPPVQFLAAGITTVGVLLMGLTDWRPGRRTLRSFSLALLCAFCFAVCDTLIQQWASSFGLGNFIPLVFLTVAMLTLIALFGARRTRVRWHPHAGRWLLTAAGVNVIQAVLITVSVGIWKDATAVNVVYALRGLWGFGIIWAVGHWFRNHERHEAGPKAMRWRFVGAILILIAVLLTVLTPARS